MKLVLLGGSLLAAAALIFAATVVAADQALDEDGTLTVEHDHATAIGSSSQVSFAGKAPANAKEIAEAHVPFPAELPPVPPGYVVKVHLALKDVTIEIAPGVKYAAWGFEGGAPGPVIHVTAGTDRRDDAHERRCDSPFDRLPRRADRPGQGVHRRACPASRSRSASKRTTRACSCTTAARSRS